MLVVLTNFKPNWMPQTMNDIEQNEIETFLQDLWPKAKFTDAQLMSFRQVFRYHPFDIVQKALMDYQASSHYTIKPSDLKDLCRKANPRAKYIKTSHFIRNERTSAFTQIIVPGYQEHQAEEIAHCEAKKYKELYGDEYKVYLNTTVRAMINMRPQYSAKTMKEVIKSVTPKRKPTHGELQSRKNQMIKELSKENENV